MSGIKPDERAHTASGQVRQAQHIVEELVFLVPKIEISVMLNCLAASAMKRKCSKNLTAMFVVMIARHSSSAIRMRRKANFAIQAQAVHWSISARRYGR